VHFHLAYNRTALATAFAATSDARAPNSTQQPSTLELILFNRTEADIIAPAVWQAQSAASRSHFVVTHVLTQPDAKWTGETGRPSHPLLTKLIRAVQAPAPASGGSSGGASAVPNSLQVCCCLFRFHACVATHLRSVWF
jgi:hypothetical protein